MSNYRYEANRAVVRLTKEVSNESIFALCDEIDLAVDYYKYEAVEIQIDSPGGSVDSMEFYLNRLRSWRNRGVRISTLAMTKAASAAGVILAMGDIGRRRAFASADLLFHHTRTQIQRPLTASDMEWHSAVMKKLDHNIDDLLVQHLLTHPALQAKNTKYPARPTGENFPKVCERKSKAFPVKTYPDGLSPKQLHEKLRKLNEMDEFISPVDAQAFYLIDHIEA